MRTPDFFFVSILCQKYALLGLQFIALFDPVPRDIIPYADTGGTGTILVVPTNINIDTADCTENKWFSVIQFCEFPGINRSSFYKYLAVPLAYKVFNLPSGIGR